MRHPFFALCLLVLFLFPSAVSAQSVDLRGYWKLDDGKNSSTVVDETGTSDGHVHGQTRLAKSGVNSNSSAIKTDNNNDYIEVPHDDQFLLDEGSIVFWFKPKSLSGRQGIFSKDSSGYDTGGHLTVYLEGKYLKVRLQSTQTSYTIKSKTSIRKGRWYHVAFVFGPGGMELYINGRLERTNSYAGGLGKSSGGIGNYEPIVLGNNSWGSNDRSAKPLREHFHGYIDEVGVLANRLEWATITEIFTQTGEKGTQNLGDFASPPPVYYVRSNGSDSNDGLTPETPWRTIQHAVKQCNRSGTTVYVGPGVYAEEVKIGSKKGGVSGTRTNPIRLIADIEGKFTLDPPGEVIVDGQNKRASGFELASVEHWSIEGFSIRNQKKHAVLLKRAGVSVIECSIDVPASCAIFGDTAGDITVTDCSFERDAKSLSAIILFPTSRLSPGPASVMITRNDLTMKGDLFMSTGYEKGIYGAGSGSGPEGTQQKRKKVIMRHGIVVVSRPWGYIDTVEVSNNQISDSLFSVFSIITQRQKVKTIIANNTIVGSYYSINSWSYRGGSLTVVNNIIDSCYFGATVYARKGRSFVVAGLLENNITAQMARYRRPFEMDIITGSPLFVDAPAGDFSLAKGSPAIDAGVMSSAPTVDIEGRERPTDGDKDGIAAADLGVTEIVGAASDRVRVVRWLEVGTEQ